MGRPRKHNKHLPPRVYQQHGAYYYAHPTDGWIRLGETMSEMYSALAKLTAPREIATMADLLYRYRVEVLPGEGSETQKDHGRALDRLTAVFGKMRPEDIRPRDVYAFRDKRGQKARTAANRDLEVLKHALAKGIEWGALESNPAREVKKFSLPRRDRYVTDAEFQAVYDVATPVLQLAMDLAVLTGLRLGDILDLTRDNLTEEGILVRTSKTGKTLLISWTPVLRSVVERAKALKPELRKHLLCSRRGRRITSNGFSSIWRRAMAKAMANGCAHYRFNDLRAKSASDDDLMAASARLGQYSTAVTVRHYRRAPSKVRPLR